MYWVLEENGGARGQFASVVYKNSIRNSTNSTRILKGYRMILQGFFKDSKTDFPKGCCRDSEGL